MRQKLSIFIMISFLLGIIAPACGFMWGGSMSGKGSSFIEICTAQGMETRLIANNNQPEQPPSPMTGKNCDFCFQNANFSSVLPTSATATKIEFQARKIRFHIYEAILLSRTSFDNAARGPPKFV